jgi:hypothetical protein
MNTAFLDEARRLSVDERIELVAAIWDTVAEDASTSEWDEKVATAVMRIFGASSLDECIATYDLVGAAERATLDEAVERVAANGNAVFLLSVDSELAS